MESLIDLNNIFFNNYKMTIILDEKNEPWFKAKDIATVLEYNNTKQTIRKNVNKEDKKIFCDLKENISINHDLPYKIQNSTKFINKNGFESLLIKSKKIVNDDIINDLITKFNLNVNKIMKNKKKDNINKIIEAFNGIDYKLQYKINEYKIDLYLVDYNLAIECNENNCSYYDQEKETERKNYIKKKLNCYLICFNPDDENFNIFKIINKIFLFILKHNKLKE